MKPRPQQYVRASGRCQVYVAGGKRCARPAVRRRYALSMCEEHFEQREGYVTHKPQGAVQNGAHF